MKNKKILVWVVGITLAVSIIWLAYNSFAPRGYTAVTTTDGAFYVGRLYEAPFSGKIRLDEGFLLRNTKTAETDKTQLNLAPFSDWLWGPKSLYIVRTNIITMGNVGEESTIGKALADYQKGK